jgi:hypothetical protein
MTLTLTQAQTNPHAHPQMASASRSVVVPPSHVCSSSASSSPFSPVAPAAAAPEDVHHSPVSPPLSPSSQHLASFVLSAPGQALDEDSQKAAEGHAAHDVVVGAGAGAHTKPLLPQEMSDTAHSDPQQSRDYAARTALEVVVVVAGLHHRDPAHHTVGRTDAERGARAEHWMLAAVRRARVDECVDACVAGVQTMNWAPSNPSPYALIEGSAQVGYAVAEQGSVVGVGVDKILDVAAAEQAVVAGQYILHYASVAVHDPSPVPAPFPIRVHGPGPDPQVVDGVPNPHRALYAPGQRRTSVGSVVTVIVRERSTAQYL